MSVADVIVYDVGHGDHVLLRLRTEEHAFHAVVDCNWADASSVPPALRQLQEWGVETLDLLVLTHPHQDHFMGLSAIARHFMGGGRRLLRWCDFGLDLRLVADRRHAARSRARQELYDLHALVHEAEVGVRPRYIPVRSPFPARPLLPGATLVALAPAPPTWGEEHARLTSGQALRPNRLSSAFLVRGASWALLLCGDLEVEDWRLALSRAQGIDLCSDVVKVGHHGAPNGNPPELWSAVRVPGHTTHAVISTRGSRLHPTEPSLRTIITAGASPRCTRWGPACAPHVPGAARAQALADLGARARSPRDAALASIGARRDLDRRCFGTSHLVLGEGASRVIPQVEGAICHLRRAWTGEA